MGWLWSSSSGDSAKTSSSSETQPSSNNRSNESSIALTEEQRMRIFGRPSPISSSSSASQSTREQAADAELDALMKEFSSSDPTNPTKALSALTKAEQQDQAQQSSTTQTKQPEPPSRLLPDGSLDISPAAIIPRTMSCRQQFDQAFYCQSLGGKFNDIYRYGHLRPCSEQWGAFWFCMRTRTLPGKEKEEAIVRYYQERDERRKKERGGKSSEDVWEVRTRAVERAFWRDPDADGDGDAAGEGLVRSMRE
ncbi:hypothetical protein BST61_g1341 [Cercospora zeina]